MKRAASVLFFGAFVTATLVGSAEPAPIPTKAPTLAGFWLGQPLAEASAKLGHESRDQTIGAKDPYVRVLESEDKSVSLVATSDQGVTTITLRSRDAVGLLGIRIGDKCDVPRTAWGTPGGSSKTDALWDFGAWVAQVHCNEANAIDRLTIAI